MGKSREMSTGELLFRVEFPPSRRWRESIVATHVSTGDRARTALASEEARTCFVKRLLTCSAHSAIVSIKDAINNAMKICSQYEEEREREKRA